MPSPYSAPLSLKEAKSKDLVPCIGETPLHSLHGPRREAEVFANNHLAQLARSSHALVLGLGFGYHLEEISKILRLRHKAAHVGVIEPRADLVRLWSSYRHVPADAKVFSPTADGELWNDPRLAAFLLEKPVVIIHPTSFALHRGFFETFLRRRSPSSVTQWRRAPDAAWMRAFQEAKHAP